MGSRRPPLESVCTGVGGHRDPGAELLSCDVWTSGLACRATSGALGGRCVLLHPFLPSKAAPRG